MAFSWLNDDQLAAREAELREAAHNAPKNSPAFGQRANDWAAVHDELERRNSKVRLTLPDILKPFVGQEFKGFEESATFCSVCGGPFCIDPELHMLSRTNES